MAPTNVEDPHGDWMMVSRKKRLLRPKAMLEVFGLLKVVGYLAPSPLLKSINKLFPSNSDMGRKSGCVRDYMLFLYLLLALSFGIISNIARCRFIFQDEVFSPRVVAMATSSLVKDIHCAYHVTNLPTSQSRFISWSLLLLTLWLLMWMGVRADPKKMGFAGMGSSRDLEPGLSKSQLVFLIPSIP
ncbi:hypothetical protein HKD37_09G024548 [Glycine soja]